VVVVAVRAVAERARGQGAMGIQAVVAVTMMGAVATMTAAMVIAMTVGVAWMTLG
jgi:hypothetical protein